MSEQLFELAVRERFDHYNNKSWFVVQDLEAGEELMEAESRAEAEHKMLDMIKKEPDRYFTQQNVLRGE